MAKKIELEVKERGAPRVFIPVERAQELVDANDPNRILQIFKSMVSQGSEKYTDKEYLELIINWVPEGGRSIVETARWIEFALIVDKFDPEKDTTIPITDKQVDMIMERLRDPNFKLTAINTQFFHFLDDFQRLCGQSIYVETKKEEPPKEA